MFILNYFISKGAVNSIKNPKIKNVFCNTLTGEIRVAVHSENSDEEYILEYNSDIICDFTSEEIYRFTYRIFTKFESIEHKSLLFDEIIMNIIDSIIISREEIYNRDDDIVK